MRREWRTTCGLAATPAWAQHIDLKPQPYRPVYESSLNDWARRNGPQPGALARLHPDPDSSAVAAATLKAQQQSLLEQYLAHGAELEQYLAHGAEPSSETLRQLFQPQPPWVELHQQ